MNDPASVFVLISVPGLPLLLAIPALQRQLPWPTVLALLPATVLLLIPGDVAVELPWILLGDSGLIMNSASRWWLAMSVVAWAAAATIQNSGPVGEIIPRNQSSWFLLGLAGQLGTVLSADMFSFFAFSSLMGYAFFGLLVIENNEGVRRAGRVYLVLLILADIALFEALLLIGAVAADLKFANLAATIAQSPEAGFSLWFILIAFALRAGIWPFHIWLPAASGSTRPVLPLLLWIGPVATALLGMMRWLPLGEITSTSAGALLQLAGAVTLLYATISGLWRNRYGQGTAYLIIATSAAIMLVFGVGLGEPLLWLSYAALVPLLIVSFGLGLTIRIAGKAWHQRKQTHPSAPVIPVSHMLDSYERWAAACLLRARRLGQDTLPGLRTAMHEGWRHRWHKHSWQRWLDAGECYIRRWSYAILTVLLLSIPAIIAGLIAGNG